MPYLHPRLVFGIIILILISSSGFAKDDPEDWCYVKFRNFEIYSHISKKKTLRLAKDLKVYVDGIEMVMPLLKKYMGGKFKILILEDQNEFSRYIPQQFNDGNTISMYQELNGYTLVCVKGSLNKKKSTGTLYRTLAKAILNNEGNYPKWFVDGMAEVFSTFDQKGSKHLTFGISLQFHNSWFRSKNYHRFAMPVAEILQVSSNTPSLKNTQTRSMFHVKCYQLCHYFMFNESKELTLKFVKFAEKCRLEGFPESQLLNGLDLTCIQLDNIILKYKRMPYSAFEYKADFSDITSKHPDSMDLQRVLFLGETTSKNYGVMGMRQLNLLQNNPEHPIALEIAALYNRTIEDDERFQRYMIQAVEAGCNNSLLELYYAKYLLDTYIEEYGERSLTLEQIEQVVTHIAPVFKEKKISDWGTQLFLYAWTQSKEEPPASIDPAFAASFMRYKSSAGILLNLASIYSRKGEKENLRVVVEQLKTLDLNKRRQKNLKWYENRLSEM